MKTTITAVLFFSLCPVLMGADIGITVVTPSRTAQAIGDVPGAVEVITGGQLESSPGVTLNDKLVNIIPGAVSSRANGIYSFTSAVTLRGLPASDQGRTLVLLDGVPANTGATGAVNWNRLAAEEIDRIEVFKGPVSSLYGSNAAAGVINVITKKAAPGYRLGASYGTYNTFQSFAGAGVKIKNLSLSADGGYLSSDGYNSTPKALRAAPDYTVNKYAREKNVSAKASLDLGGSGIVEAQYSRDEGLRGEGTRIRTVDGVSRQYDTDFARAAWHGDNGGLAWQTQAYYQLENYSRLNESVKSNVYSRTNTDASRQDTGGQAAVSLPLAGVNATVGADYKLGSAGAIDHNVAPAPSYDDKNRGRISQYAPYAQAEKKFLSDRLELLAGLRYDNATYFDGFFNNPSNNAYKLVNGPQSSRYWNRFSPKLAASWQYSAGTDQYISYGRGFRPPSLEDMCLTLLKKTVLNIANPDLKPETIDTVETGFKLAPLPGLFVDPAAYYTIGRDFIYTANLSATLAQKRNIGRVKIYGAELPVKYYVNNLSFAAAYAWSDSRIEDAPGYTALEGRTLTNSPHATASASVGFKTAPADLMLGWIYKSKQFTKDDNSEWVRGYHVFSASAARAFTRNTSAKLSVENILNERHQEGFVIAPPSSASIPDLAPGRTVTVSMQAKF